MLDLAIIWQSLTDTPQPDEGANHDNLLSTMYKSVSDVEISVACYLLLALAAPGTEG